MSQHTIRTRVGALLAVGAITAMATACQGKDDKKAAKADTGSPAAGAPSTGGAGTAGGASDKPSGAAKSDDTSGGGSGDKAKYAADLQTYLKGTKLGAHVLEVRAEKPSLGDYTITVNTDFASTDDPTGVMTGAEKLTNEAEKWVQEHANLKVSYIEVLDKAKGVKGNANLDNTPKNKSADDAYAKDMLTALKDTANGAKISDVKVYSDSTQAKAVVYTTIQAETNDVETDLGSMDAASQIANEAKQWAQDRTTVKITYIEVLDVEKGLRGNNNL
jgi:hypothetical protein